MTVLSGESRGFYAFISSFAFVGCIIAYRYVMAYMQQYPCTAQGCTELGILDPVSDSKYRRYLPTNVSEIRETQEQHRDMRMLTHLCHLGLWGRNCCASTHLLARAPPGVCSTGCFNSNLRQCLHWTECCMLATPVCLDFV